MNLTSILVDDGSEPATRQGIADLAGDSVHVIRLARNSGKGVAVSAGLRLAQQLNFSHALQIDADGQHDLDDITKLIAVSRSKPAEVIAGARAYADMPVGRRRGRRFTDFWVNLNTRSKDIADSMCGLRIYPVDTTVALIAQSRIGARMEFDTDIAVRLFWRGLKFTNVDVAVAYPDQNVSHFRIWSDNVRISAMHARHFVGMISRWVKHSIWPHVKVTLK